MNQVILDDDEAEFKAEVEALANNPKFQEIMAKSRQSLKEKGGIPLDDVMREFGIE